LIWFDQEKYRISGFGGLGEPETCSLTTESPRSQQLRGKIKSAVNYRKYFNRKNDKPVLSHDPVVNWRNDGNVTAKIS
jgi:hypothetical protein